MARTLSALALVVLATTTMLLADDPPKKPTDTPPQSRAKGMLPRYFKSLGLSDEQKQQVYRIQNTYGAKIDALTAQIKALHAEQMQEIEKLLTDAQKARLKELKLGETKTTTDKATDKDKGKASDPPSR
jgi:hypothetical protein